MTTTPHPGGLRAPRGRPRVAGRRLPTVAAIATGAVAVVAAYGLLLVEGDRLYPLINEDGWVETAGAIALAVAGVAFLAAGAGLRRDAGDWPRAARASLVGLGLLFVVGAGEEVSWGERFLGYEPPEALTDNNAQGESTLHNLEGVDGRVDDLFTAFVALFAIALPLAASRWPAVRARAGRLVPILPAGVAVLFLVNEITFRLAWWAMPRAWYSGLHDFSQSAHEIRETVASLLFAAAALLVRPPRTARAADEAARATG